MTKHVGPRYSQLDQVSGIEDTHHFKKAAKDEGVAPRERVVRCGKEMAGLATDLPCSPSSSVFVRLDQRNVVLWRALITGGPSCLRCHAAGAWPC